ncbi:hypothetical protein WCN79_04795 [Xanthomonas axonopodis pv. vasculorum]|uniref:Uncharacterized protein n=1 Tax=Xanthomonas axonopodis pv. vasculorum TaxID=325777 RepID=A0A098Q5X1_9XANT|nr:hypothetical protein [Xanthomonas axonopodis]KGE53342.1 hypothetical protein GW15_0202895 [Xanthomonas axonopodis pv. vasculorum]PPV07543.1 hypothetical protein XavaCFBP5823_18810 [Xanthomonas axonopodis pv. vasculorum]QKD87939.1 hypothetical protein XAV_18425 [Xanthomonas axonopodis pv. vasculorum]
MRTHVIIALLVSLVLVTAAPTRAQTASASASASAPSQPMSEVTTRYPVTTAMVGGRVIRLGEHQGKCAVARDDEVVVLSIGAPCYFSIDRQHAAQVHRFHGSDIVLVQHAHPTWRPDWDVAVYGPICAFKAQAVREVGGVLEPDGVAGSWHCDPTAGADQKQFVYSYDTWPRHGARRPARKQKAH